ncbi:MAG: hypothetical protein HYY93_04545 [Planctomycetes bacterium]|nr:hypothetical protein [Planctomycetota bacterium]
MKALVLLNPRAWRWRRPRGWNRLRSALDVAFPGEWSGETPIDGEGNFIGRIAEALNDGFDRVCILGGDGTVRCAVEGWRLARLPPWNRANRPSESLNPDLALAVLPAGTGNDFARGLGIPRDPVEAVRVAASGATRLIDLVEIVPAAEPEAGSFLHYRHFANIAEAGFGAAVAARASRSRKTLGAKATFRLAVARELIHLHNAPIRIEAVTPDGPRDWEGESTGVILANGRFFGAGLNPAPTALWDDGLLDVIILGAFSRREIVRHFGKIARGDHLGHSKVHHLRASSLRISSPEKVPFEMDGEGGGSLPVEARVIPRALRVCVPA